MVVEQAASVGLRQAPKAISSLWSYASDYVSKSDFLNFSENYRTYLVENYSRIKVLGMTEPREIDDIYTELRFLKEIPSRKYQSIEEMTKRAEEAVENWQKDRIKDRVNEKIEDELKREAIADQFSTIDARSLEQNRKAKQLKDKIKREAESKRIARSAKRAKSKAEREILQEPLTDAQLIEKANRFPAEFDNALADAIEQQLDKSIQESLSPLDFNDLDLLPTESVVKDKRQLIVLGKPGAGKSTFIKHLMMKNLKSSSEDAKLPVIIILREYVDSGATSLIEYIKLDFENSGFNNPGPFIEKIFRKKDAAILLLDGLDEVPTSRYVGVVDEINRLCRRYKSLQCVSSCRLATYRGELLGFSEYELSDLRKGDISGFAESWFGGKTPIFRSFVKDLASNPGLRELTTTPLLLTILCVSYKRNLRFPEQKSLLYLNCIDTLFIDWDASRQIRRKEYLEHFDVESKKFVLGKVACDAFCERALIFYRRELSERLEHAAESLPGGLQNGELMLREFLEHHGILLERSKGVYSFSHLTFQEFFNALHISRHPSMRLFSDLAEQYAKEDRWRESLLFLAGLLSSSEQLLMAIDDVARKSIQSLPSKHLVLGSQLPKSVQKFLLENDNSEKYPYWRAWFACRIAEYQTQAMERLAGDRNARVHFSLQSMSRTIEEIGELKENGRGIGGNRKINAVLSEAFRHVERLPSTATIPADDIDAWRRYFSLTGLSIDILASRARCKSDFKREFIEGLFTSRTTTLNYTASEPNLLGI